MSQEETKTLITELANALFVTDKQLAVLVAQSRSDPPQWEPVHKSNAELYARAAAYLKANPDLNPTNVADLIWILDRAAEFFTIAESTTWALRALRYKEFFSKKQ
jgi:hypothetical protein